MPIKKYLDYHNIKPFKNTKINNCSLIITIIYFTLYFQLELNFNKLL